MNYDSFPQSVHDQMKQFGVKERNNSYNAIYPQLLSRVDELLTCSPLDREDRLQEALCWSFVEYKTGQYLTIDQLAHRALAHSVPFAREYAVISKPYGKEVLSFHAAENADLEPTWCDRRPEDNDNDDPGFRMADLPEHLASVASMKLLGMTREQMAERIGVSLGTVKNRLNALREVVKGLQGLAD